MLRHHSQYRSRRVGAFCHSRNDLPTMIQMCDDVDYCIDAPEMVPAGSSVRVEPIVEGEGGNGPFMVDYIRRA